MILNWVEGVSSLNTVLASVQQGLVKLTRVGPYFARLWAIAMTVALVACASTSPLEVYAPKPVEPVESVLALSPGAGAIINVVQTGYNNATEQMIVLDTNSRAPGQNYFKVQVFEAVAHSATPGGLQDVPLANIDLAGEARGTVNYADMKLSPYFVQNAYGPFGYSMGRTATADLCMYAWQRIAPDRSPGGGVRRGAINLRALICDRNRTETELLEIMYQLRIKGVTGVATLAPSEIGAYGAIIMPIGPNGVKNVLPNLPRPARSTAPAAPAAEPSPAVVAPSTPEYVPPPLGPDQGPIVPPPSD